MVIIFIYYTGTICDVRVPVYMVVTYICVVNRKIIFIPQTESYFFLSGRCVVIKLSLQYKYIFILDPKIKNYNEIDMTMINDGYNMWHVVIFWHCFFFSFECWFWLTINWLDGYFSDNFFLVYCDEINESYLQIPAWQCFSINLINN